MGLSISCSGPSQKTIPQEDIQPPITTKAQKKVPVNFGPTNTGKNLIFQERASKYGLGNTKSTHNYIVDWNGDGRDDLVILPEYYGPATFYEFNKKKKKFIEVDSPFGKVTRASFMAFADFNRDGLLDVILATLNQKTELNKDPLRLFLASKKGGKVTYTLKEGVFPTKIYPTSSLSLIDYNMDGMLDIFLGNWYDVEKKGDWPAPDRLYVAQGDGLKFADASLQLEGEHEYNSDMEIYKNATPTFGSSICDIDQNGYPDILTASSSGYSNRMWLNLKEKGEDSRYFVNYAEQSGFAHDQEGAFSPLGGGNSFYAICQDYNNDGVFDVAMGELFHSYDSESRDRSAILTGSRFEFPPKFLRTEYHKDDGSGSWNQGDRRAVWIDYNFDSFTDLLVENSGFPPKSRLIAFDQGPDHSFADLASELGIDISNPSGLSIGDVNGDGKPDLFVGQVTLRDASIEPRLYLFENQIPWQGRKILKIKLKGKKANVHGIGATVSVKTNRAQYMKVVDFLQGGLPSQNAEGLIFGLQKGEVVEFIEVRWPFLKKDQSGRKYPYRKKYPGIKVKSSYEEITLTDF